MELSQETRDEIIALARKVVKAFSEAVRKFCEWVRENWEFVKVVAVKWYQLEEEKKFVQRRRFKKDFTRHKFSHQVIDRRPHLVRKIIR